MKVIKGGGPPRDLPATSHIIRPKPEPDSFVWIMRYGGLGSGPIVTIDYTIRKLVSRTAAEIPNIVVVPATFRGRGYGTRTLKLFINWAKTQHIRHIDALKVPQPTFSFWDDNGFVEVPNTNRTFRYRIAITPA